MTIEERLSELELTVKVMKCHLGDVHLESLKRQVEESEATAKAKRDSYNSTLEAIKSGTY
ncbi:hypothetical protein [Symbiopectobacterium sp. RP]|uniref:hypothetical protein n=1 Tax=Symbiopectobacterium sp. RP TaxID=3248553 RepID=UPI003D26FA16